MVICRLSKKGYKKNVCEFYQFSLEWAKYI